MSRYVNRIERVIADDRYKDALDRRGLKFIEIHNAPKLRYPTAQEISRLRLESRVWKRGDRLYKLAHEYYGNSKYWFVIAWFNRTPTDAVIRTGQVIYIPTPLDQILGMLGI